MHKTFSKNDLIKFLLIGIFQKNRVTVGQSQYAKYWFIPHTKAVNMQNISLIDVEDR